MIGVNELADYLVQVGKDRQRAMAQAGIAQDVG